MAALHPLIAFESRPLARHTPAAANELQPQEFDELDPRDWARISRLMDQIDRVERELDHDIRAGRGIWKPLASRA